VTQPDLQTLLRKAQEMQSRMNALQRELARRTVEGAAGGGMVRVVANGELRILSVEIEPGLVTQGDRAMLQDLVAAATNAALECARAMVQDEMQRVARESGAAIPLPPPGPGGE
jgi:hypothetical protein